MWQQQRSALQSMNDDHSPRTAFQEDFAAAPQTWMAMGDHIIIGGDVNEHVTHDSVTSFFSTFQMSNLIFCRCDSSTAKHTYFRSPKGRAIDGLWGMSGLKIRRCGHLEPKDFTGDHSLLWVDIAHDDSLGHNPPKPLPPDARRLKTGLPKPKSNV